MAYRLLVVTVMIVSVACGIVRSSDSVRLRDLPAFRDAINYTHMLDGNEHELIQVSLFDASYSRWVELFVSRLSNFSRHPIMLVCMDAGAASVCEAVASIDWYAPVCCVTCFGCSVMRVKAEILASLLEEKLEVFMMDMDVIFFRNPLPVLFAGGRHPGAWQHRVPIPLQTCQFTGCKECKCTKDHAHADHDGLSMDALFGAHYNHARVNIGLVYLRPTPAAVDWARTVFRFITSASTYDGSMHRSVLDQVIMDALLPGGNDDCVVRIHGNDRWFGNVEFPCIDGNSTTLQWAYLDPVYFSSDVQCYRTAATTAVPLQDVYSAHPIGLIDREKKFQLIQRYYELGALAMLSQPDWLVREVGCL